MTGRQSGNPPNYLRPISPHFDGPCCQNHVILDRMNTPEETLHSPGKTNRSDWSQTSKQGRYYERPSAYLIMLGDTNIAKNFKYDAGIASQMFKALADEGINIRMISTSEIKISVVVDEKYLELGVRALHSEFGLDEVKE